MALNQQERFFNGLNRYFNDENEKSGCFYEMGSCKAEKFMMGADDIDKSGCFYEMGSYKVEKFMRGSDDIGDFRGRDRVLGKSKMGCDDVGDQRDETTKMGCDDIVDLLPQDPFDMDISSKVTAFTGWLENLDKDFGLKALGFCTDEFEVDAQLFAELNLVLNGAMRIHQDVGGVQKIGEKSYEIDIGGEGLHSSFGCMDIEMEDVMKSGYWVFSDVACKDKTMVSDDRCGGDGGAPSDALFLALGYLGLRDLLSVEGVCKALRDAVRGDPLLWRNIHLDHPLSGKITNDILINLTDRAQGSLQSLSLVHCSKITDGGLKCVLERNSSLEKLCVPGCGRLTADGVLSNLKAFKSRGKFRLKYLAVDGLYGVTNQHYEEFKELLGINSNKVPTTRKLRFFQGGQLSLFSDDDQGIDIEICPKCQQLRLIYDCPSESCQKKQSTTQCRACTICIKRCINCGRCLNNCEYEELFSFDLLCLDCCRRVLDRQERQEILSVPLETSVLHKQASCHFFLCG